jgi:hypothetical protein
VTEALEEALALLVPETVELAATKVASGSRTTMLVLMTEYPTPAADALIDPSSDTFVTLPLPPTSCDAI